MSGKNVRQTCHCRLERDPYVSRNHFLLEANPPLLTLRDLSSHNGTVVNGRLFGGPEADGAAECKLAHGDRIRVGDHGFRVEARFQVEWQGANEWARPWFELERLCFRAQLGEELKDIDGEVRELFASVPADSPETVILIPSP